MRNLSYNKISNDYTDAYFNTARLFKEGSYERKKIMSYNWLAWYKQFKHFKDDECAKRNLAYFLEDISKAVNIKLYNTLYH